MMSEKPTFHSTMRCTRCYATPQSYNNIQDVMLASKPHTYIPNTKQPCAGTSVHVDIHQARCDSEQSYNLLNTLLLLSPFCNALSKLISSRRC